MSVYACVAARADKHSHGTAAPQPPQQYSGIMNNALACGIICISMSAHTSPLERVAPAGGPHIMSMYVCVCVRVVVGGHDAARCTGLWMTLHHRNSLAEPHTHTHIQRARDRQTGICGERSAIRQNGAIGRGGVMARSGNTIMKPKLGNLFKPNPKLGNLFKPKPKPVQGIPGNTEL